MARVLESVAKELLAKNGITTPDNFVAKNVEEALAVADKIGYPIIIKALVPVGKKGKAGAVKPAQDAKELKEVTKHILSLTVHNFPVERVLVERKLEISRELYACITFDSSKRMPVVIASNSGGMDIEEIARNQPEKIIKYHVNMQKGLPQFKAKEIWSDLGLTGKCLQKATGILWRLYQFFTKYDANIIEINPLAVTFESDVIAAAILMGVDDDALYRQAELSNRVESGGERAWRPLTALEKKMIAVDAEDPYRGTARYVEIDGGDIGFLCGGGGGSLLVYDSLLRFGGKPANYTEFGGNPPEAKVIGLVQGVLSKPGVKGFILNVNITNNTRTDVVASGVIRAFKNLGIDPVKFPNVVRLAGVNDNEARALCLDAGIEYYGDDITMEDAARLIVEKMKSAYH